MQKEFWLERWRTQQIGFHQHQYNASLIEHWPALGAQAGATVFVPLCGKSLDMCFLAEQGLNVIGVELSETAVQAFFDGQQLSPTISQVGQLRQYQAGPFTLYVGDIFELGREPLQHCHWVYDRAALIALPEPMRSRYCEHLAKQLPRPCRSLTITVQYPPDKISAPPFCIGSELLYELQDSWADISPLGQRRDTVKGLDADELSFVLDYQ